jgi:hypothetical protein
MGDWNIHIDGGKTTVGDGTADSTGKGESGVEGKARLLLGSLSLDVLDDSVDLGGSGRGSHFEDGYSDDKGLRGDCWVE